jgi:hypothetical protein
MDLNAVKLCTFDKDGQELHPVKVIAENFFSFIPAACHMIPGTGVLYTDRSGHSFLKL